MKELLKVEKLKLYAKDKPITSINSASVGEGEVILVTGPSGGGKTSFLRCIAGLNNLFNIEFSGFISLSINRDYISYIPQEPWFGVISPYPVLEVMSFSEEYEDHVHRYVKLFNVEHVLESNSMDLSAGEIQRILFIEAILSRSKLILVDEITAYLDEELRKQLVDVVEEVRNSYEMSFVVVDHDIELWRNRVDKVLYVEPMGESWMYPSVDEIPLINELDELKAEVKNLSRNIKDVLGKDTQLKLSNVWFRYPDSREYTIKGVNLDIRRGELVAIRGPSGKGKSTLLKLIAGIYRTSRGAIKRFTKNIQYIPENPLLYLSEPTPRDELLNQVDLALKSSLVNALDTPITRLSSGERRRLAIASALARGADIVLVDEPSVGLDVKNLVNVLKLLAEAITKGVSVVIATHSSLLSSSAHTTVLL
ncbi:MAG: ATP-binding cassette domain-containing protein [Ignisphaera sp.]|uniref:ATP-binding cassette domain-containing protein n=1 Tax=Ignisphaera aggregans TaxID=334771 RepID=A0A7C4NK25_9CREN